MKLERIPEYLTVTIVTSLGIGLALYCGRLTGQGQMGMLALIVAAILGLFVSLQLRSQIWVLIPIVWALTGRVTVLPLPFSVRDLGVMVACAITLALIALKFIRRKPSYDRLDLLLAATVLCLIFAFVRNPVGTLATGADRVGGKPYFDVFIGFLAYLVLTRATIEPSWAPRMPFLFSLGYILNSLISVVAYQFPWTVPYLTQFYSSVNVEAYERESIGGSYSVIERQSHLAGLGESLGLFLCSHFRPLTLISPVHWFRAGLFVLASICALLSGHRMSIVDIGVYFLLASYFQRGMREVIHLMLAGLPILGFILLLHGTVFTLPVSAQRALSFLPGSWDVQAKDDAEGSLEWRFDMWRRVLSTDRYIENKLLGDGFGYSLREYQNALAANSWGLGDQSQENALHQGAFHSGPLSVVRTVGYVGLVIFIVVLVTAARRAVRVIRRAENTPFYPLALFICIPLVYEPLKFVVIFGSFENGLPHALFTTGLLKLLEFSLDQYQTSHAAQSAPLVSKAVSTRRVPVLRKDLARLR